MSDGFKNHIEILGLEVSVDPESRKLAGAATGAMGGDFAQRLDAYLAKLNKGKVLAERRGGNVYSLYQPPVPSAAAARVIAHRIKRFTMGHVIPSTATMSATYACQCKCQHCSAVHYMARGKGKDGLKELTTEEFCRVIDETIELGAVNIALSGGEPLLRKDIMTLINHVPTEKANVMLFTNGILLTEERVKELAASNLFSIMISLDSSKPEEHNEYRQYPGLFEKAIAGAKRALEGGLLVGFSTYATKEALDSGELEARIKLAKDVGVQELTIFDPVPTGMFLDRDDIILSDEDKQRIIDLGNEWSSKPGPFKVTPQAHVNSPRGAGCFAGYHQFYMTAHGEVCPCDFTPLSFGNVRKDSVRAIWRRILEHPAYCNRSGHCRMQDDEFRKRYIKTIPKGATTPFYIGEREKVGVLAGFGEFPVLFAKEVVKKGFEPVIIAIEDENNSALEKVVSHLHSAGVGELEKVVNIFKKQGVSNIVMVGKYHKDKIFTDLKLDDRMKKLLQSIKIKDDANLLKAIGEELEREGLKVREPNEYLESLLVPEGVLTKREPSDLEMADVRYGFEMAKEISNLGIGQTVVAKNGTILAVEAIEGTDRAIIRASSLSNGGNVVVKVSAPDHDMRYDTPVIGSDTVNTLFSCGAKVLAVEAGKTIILDRVKVIQRADDREISIIAL